MIELERLAHRGLWNDTCEKNSRVALENAFGEGFGVETDLRDQNGTIVISHDPPAADGKPLVTFEYLLALYRKSTATGTLALNIKSDGLAAEVNRLLTDFQIEKYFVFDMSVPDMLSYHKLGMRCFSRQSEFESPVIFDGQNGANKTHGIWLDSFSETWYPWSLIQKHLEAGLDVCLVSPELHGRSPGNWWNDLKAFTRTTQLEERIASGKLSVCTDDPHF